MTSLLRWAERRYHAARGVDGGHRRSLLPEGYSPELRDGLGCKVPLFPLSCYIAYIMQTLGQFIVERRKELGLAGREVVAEVRNSDGKPISIPFLVDLEHDRRKPSDEVLEQLAKVLKVDSDVLYFLAGRFPADLSATTVNSAEELAAGWKAFRREVKRRKKP